LSVFRVLGERWREKNAGEQTSSSPASARPKKEGDV